MRILLAFIAFTLITNYTSAQCADSTNIYSFVYNGKTYEVVRENKSWIDAAACAVSRGGILTEINDLAEQNAIFNELDNNASIITNNTIAPDGGGASYIWIGGNDLQVEGNWVWNGNNDSNSVQFWMGTASGSPIGGLYNNWGNEPDNFGSGQDGLALALTNWPLGSISQWNDVDHNNTLYYVIEYDAVVGINDINFNNQLNIFPNPISNFITIQTTEYTFNEVTIINLKGQELRSIKLNNVNYQKMDLSDLKKGIYLLKIVSDSGQSITRKVVK